jgi:hypothetical protein
MSINSAIQNKVPDVSAGPLIAGAVLIGAGAVLALAGLAISGSHVLSATRRWIQELEVPPSELARIKWEQARSAATAGATAWQNGVAAGAPSGS